MVSFILVFIFLFVGDQDGGSLLERLDVWKLNKNKNNVIDGEEVVLQVILTVLFCRQIDDLLHEHRVRPDLVRSRLKRSIFRSIIYVHQNVRRTKDDEEFRWHLYTFVDVYRVFTHSHRHKVILEGMFCLRGPDLLREFGQLQGISVGVCIEEVVTYGRLRISTHPRECPLSPSVPYDYSLVNP